ncbi:RNB family domain-containing protein [Toxoplasma gondii RUB]|uniref:RNB family domain-containing protein n=1 Tax=Toxoplasma gondii RUB TaxID=935652 RepID=A0A086LSQ2_TOXGO|nr:RNB family domain-containing protein [Toxoplasma gondii RUB]
MEKVYREKVTRQLSTEALSSASGASGATTPSQGNSHRTATNAASRIEAGSGGERRGKDGGERRREAGAAQTHLRDGERRGRRNAEKTGPPGGRKEERETEEGSRRGERKKQFEEYVSCQQAHAGTEEGIYVKGVLRVSAGRVDEAYVKDSRNPLLSDFLVAGLRDRNRAFHGDTVVLQIHDWTLWRRQVDAFSLGEVTTDGDSRSSSSQDALSEATCLELVRDGKMLRTAKVVYVETRLLTQAEKMHLVPPLATEEEKEAKEKKEDKDKDKEKRDEDGVDGGREMLDDEREEAMLAGAEKSQRRAKETARVALDPPWLRRNLRYNRTFICTLRGNHANSRTAPEDDITVFPDDTLLRAIPLDKRISWVLIPLREAQNWVSLPGPLDKQRLYLVNVDVWDAFNVLPRGSILTYIGPADSVQTIERCCMLQNDLQAHMLPHSQEVLAESDEIVRVAEESFETEARRRVDLRGVRRVFTIDPASARDLDDAVHVHRLPASAWTGRDPEIEIGVHIADVSHFLSPLCKTDEEARERCTTVYLTHVVFPMLPRALCDSLCSLHLGSPKLTFSVNFRVHEDGSLVKAWPPRFYKSVQVLIDGGDLPPDSRPTLASPWSSPSVTLGTCGCFVALSPASASSSSSGVSSRSVVPASCAREMTGPSFPFAPRANVEAVQSCCGSCASCCACGRGERQELGGVARRSDRLETRGERNNEEARENVGAPGKPDEVSWTAVVDDLRLLDALTVEIRKKRFANGSLLLHKATLRFALDARSRPTDWHLEEQGASMLVLLTSMPFQ